MSCPPMQSASLNIYEREGRKRIGERFCGTQVSRLFYTKVYSKISQVVHFIAKLNLVYKVRILALF